MYYGAPQTKLIPGKISKTPTHEKIHLFMNTLTEILDKLANRIDLSQQDVRSAMQTILRGEASPEQIAGFLIGMRTKGETIDELIEAVRVMREVSVRVDADTNGAVDLCGTGGDRSGTFNISTTTMFVVAGAGVPVLKHGNRSVSSKSGSFDVLESLGAKPMLGKEQVEIMFQETGMAFMFAPLFHPALKHVMPVRRALRVRTFFNILGPLLNPAGVSRQVIGAFSPEVARQMRDISAGLGAERVMTLSAADGLDEFSTVADTDVFEWGGGVEIGGLEDGGVEDGSVNGGSVKGGSVKGELDSVRVRTGPKRISAEEYGYQPASSKELQGGDASENAAILLAILEGRSTRAQRDIVELNAMFGILCSGAASSLKEAQAMAWESIDSGAARQKLAQFVDWSSKLEHGGAP